MNSLAALRAKLQAKSNTEHKSSNDNAIYPFWNIPQDSTASIRFLPDGDGTNDFFWVEANKIRLSFAGITGQTDKEVVVQVPCMEMWGETCPILTEIRPWFKEAGLEETAKKYWKKRSYIFQGFVRDDPLAEADKAENPIRRFVINPSIFKIIEQTLMDPEMEDIPTDYMSGTDFRITKGQKGQYADYATSGYSRKTSPLTDVESAAIETHGLFNLSDFLPKKPDAAGVAIIAEMFEASYNGEAYNPERWANFYKPYGLNYDASSAPAPAQTAPAVVTTIAEVAATAATPVVEIAAPVAEVVVEAAPVVAETVVEAPAVEAVAPVAAAVEGQKSPQDILASIKARKDSNG